MIGELTLSQIAEIRAVVMASGAIEAPGDVLHTFCIAMKQHPEYGALASNEDAERCEVPIVEAVDLMQTLGMVEVLEHTKYIGLEPSGRSFRFLVPPAFVVVMMNMKADVIRLHCRASSSRCWRRPGHVHVDDVLGTTSLRKWIQRAISPAGGLEPARNQPPTRRGQR